MQLESLSWFPGHMTKTRRMVASEIGSMDAVCEIIDARIPRASRNPDLDDLTAGKPRIVVLNRVDQAKSHNDNLAAEVREVIAAMVKNPVAAVATGRIMNFLKDVERATQTTDEHLTEIMMAQDFHDLTGQVIARVVTLAGNIEQQLVQLVIETAPPHAIPAPPEPKREHLAGPVVDPENNPDVVTDQSQVDDLLASLGF